MLVPIRCITRSGRADLPKDLQCGGEMNRVQKPFVNVFARGAHRVDWSTPSSANVFI